MQETVAAVEEELDTSDYADSGSQGQVLVLQNLGPGDLYFDFLTGVAVGTGVKIAAGGGYEITNWRSSMSIFLISNSTADLRYTVAG